MNRKTKKLLKKLESESPKERFDTVMALGMMGDTELIAPLDKVANLDDNPKVRDIASKAVQILETLRQRRLKSNRKALEIEEEGEDLGVEWPELVDQKMLTHREIGGQVDDEDFDYLDSKKRELLRKKETQLRAEEEGELRRQREAAEAQRRRRPFRIFLLFATTFAVIGLVFVVWYLINVDPPPETRAETLSQLQTWVRDQQTSLQEYQTLMDNDPLDCTALLGIEIPERPLWSKEYTAVDAPDSEEEGVFTRFANGLNRINTNWVVGLEVTALSELDRADTRLNDIQSSTKAACGGRETVSQAEWTEYAQVGGFVISGLRSANDAASAIDRAQGELVPTLRIDALESLQIWLQNQETATQLYGQQLAGNPLICEGLLAVSVPPRPGWLVNAERGVGILAGTELILDELNKIETNLNNISNAVGLACTLGCLSSNQRISASSGGVDFECHNHSRSRNQNRIRATISARNLHVI